KKYFELTDAKALNASTVIGGSLRKTGWLVFPVESITLSRSTLDFARPTTSPMRRDVEASTRKNARTFAAVFGNTSGMSPKMSWISSGFKGVRFFSEASLSASVRRILKELSFAAGFLVIHSMSWAKRKKIFRLSWYFCFPISDFGLKVFVL